MTVRVVTDSTACLPPERLAALGVDVVPLRVQIGQRTAIDGVDVSSAEVAQALRSKVNVSTSRPAPAEFAEKFQQVLDSGASHVVSVHISSALSGTWESAVLAAQDFPHGVVRVVDSRNTAMGLGFAVIAAAEKAAAGGSAAEVQGAATATVDATRTLFYVDTLEHLRRGGRIGAASALLGTALSVKPILHVVDGAIVVRDKVRTAGRALAKLVDLAVEASGDGEVDIAVHHLEAPERAAALADAVSMRLSDRLRDCYITEIGAVVAAHVGPGVAGVVVHRR